MEGVESRDLHGVVLLFFSSQGDSTGKVITEIASMSKISSVRGSKCRFRYVFG